jgi:hypothetical protein
VSDREVSSGEDSCLIIVGKSCSDLIERRWLNSIWNGKREWGRAARNGEKIDGWIKGLGLKASNQGVFVVEMS